MKITAAILPLALALHQASAFAPLQQRKHLSLRSTLRLRMADDFADKDEEEPEQVVRATIPISALEETAPAPPAPVGEETPAPAPAAGSEPTGALVAISQENVEFTAGVIGAALGLYMGGPYLAAIIAAAANLASKSEGNAVGTLSKSGIQVYNSLLGLNAKYELSDKAGKTLSEAVSKLKTSDSVDPEFIEKIEEALATATSKITQVNDEYDLVGAFKTALGVIGDIVQQTVKKAGELNEQYDLTTKAKDALDAGISKSGVSESLVQATSLLNEKKEELTAKMAEVGIDIDLEPKKEKQEVDSEE